MKSVKERVKCLVEKNRRIFSATLFFYQRCLDIENLFRSVFIHLRILFGNCLPTRKTSSGEVARVRIFIACHKEYKTLDSEIFTPIHVGRSRSDLDLKMIGDDTGTNISCYNNNYAELTALYWAYKNLSSEITHIGLMHYRRYFNFSKRYYSHPYDRITRLNQFAIHKFNLRDEDVVDMCARFDILVPEKSVVVDEDGVPIDMYNQYGLRGIQEDFDLALGIMKASFPDVYSFAEVAIQESSIHLKNMCILRRDIFDEYCDFLFTITDQMKMKKSFQSEMYQTDGSYYSRVFGFLGERLFSIFIDYKLGRDSALRVLHLQRCYVELDTFN